MTDWKTAAEWADAEERYAKRRLTHRQARLEIRRLWRDGVMFRGTSIGTDEEHIGLVFRNDDHGFYRLLEALRSLRLPPSKAARRAKRKPPR